uniref:putative hydro-lyase A1S_1268 n=1 Tax=Styela clava TaxID=7725 RepID=UPI0019394BC7|nr:putative hydro-lyase A1S_1268 [Styela clava]
MSKVIKNAIMDAMKAVEVRQLIRRGKNKQVPTMGWCRGEKQANIAILQKDAADDFAKFAAYNEGCLPILHQSKPGEKETILAKNSDITTDLPGYKIYKNGEMEKIIDSAEEYDWKEMVTFYIGCSFSFDDILMEYKIPVRNIEQNTNVSMYKTNIKCHSVGPFQCNMIVSMRPIPEHQLSLVVDITSQMPDVHGAPVHIGDPDVIISNTKFEDPHFGSFVALQDGDVPVFWACGVTNSEAIRAAKRPFAITHCPGMMFLTDVPQERYDESKPDNEKCKVIKYSNKDQRFSIVSVQAEKCLAELEEATVDDPGKRGSKNLLVPGDFMKSSLALSHASSIAITTGFPCHDHEPPDETDGLPGVYSLAGMLQALGKEITLIVDKAGLKMNIEIMKKQVDAGILQKEIKVISYIGSDGTEHALTNDDGRPIYDVILATERCGSTENGKYYTMKGKDISAQVGIQLDQHGLRGVGDGGNELGMGKVIDKVKKFIPNGETIACDVQLILYSAELKDQ